MSCCWRPRRPTGTSSATSSPSWRCCNVVPSVPSLLFVESCYKPRTTMLPVWPLEAPHHRRRLVLVLVMVVRMISCHASTRRLLEMPRIATATMTAPRSRDERGSAIQPRATSIAPVHDHSLTIYLATQRVVCTLHRRQRTTTTTTTINHSRYKTSIRVWRGQRALRSVHRCSPNVSSDT